MQDERTEDIEGGEEVEAHRHFSPPEPPAEQPDAEDDEVEAHMFSKLAEGPQEFSKLAEKLAE